MFENNSFGRTMDVLKRSMRVSNMRRDVIAENIANSDTPNFKRSVINFESELKKALSSNGGTGLQAAMTDSRHIPFSREIDYRTVRPRLILDYTTQSKNNGNNVDIEEEMMNSLNNQLSYTLMAQVVATQFQQINIVLR